MAYEVEEAGVANEVEDVGIAEKNLEYNSPTYVFSIIHVFQKKDVWEFYTELLMLSSLPCFHTFYRSDMPASSYNFNILYYL